MSVPNLADYNGGTLPTTLINAWLAAIRFALPISAIKGSDQTVNNSATLVNDNTLLIPVAANATYEFRLRLAYNSGATPGFKFTFTVPAGAAVRFNSLVMNGGGLKSFTHAPGDTPALDGGATDLPVTLWGEITVAGTPGTVQLQWAQVTANASNTIVRANSNLIARQVA